MCNEQNQNTASLISLLDIARWQVSGLENYLSTSSEAINTDLPALQRGAVWKTKQTEQLWDSILRGFPIGSFILSKAEKEAIEDIGKGNFKLKMIDTNTGSSEPTHFLLDGQQRATAIALGFYDIWSDKKVEDAPLALWLDLSPNESKEAVAHNKYLFRVTTRAHIWGYQANDPSKRLSANAMRNALSAFDAKNNKRRPAEIQLHETWPWDAVAPVPFALIIKAVLQNPDPTENALATLKTSVQALPIMQIPEGFEDKAKEAKDHWEKQQKAINAAFDGEQLKELLKLLKLRLNCYKVPLLFLPKESNQENNNEKDVDAIESLFVRINSAGTPLEGEEMMYSLLKSKWPDLPNLIEKKEIKEGETGIKNRLTTPARIAVLAFRLVKAEQQTENKYSQWVPEPSVKQFRKEIDSLLSDFKTGKKEPTEKLKQIFKAFQDAYEFLTTEIGESQDSYALPPTVAANFAQGSSDFFFLLLHWLLRLRLENKNWKQSIKEDRHKQVLGFLTALAWFSGKKADKAKIAQKIWKQWKENENANFFSATDFKVAFSLDDGSLLLPRLLPPCKLAQALTEGVFVKFDKNSSPDIWKNWNWYHWLSGNQKPSAINYFYGKTEFGEKIDKKNKNWESEESNQFFNHLWGNKEMLLFAQRQYLKKWFPDFDPSRPEFLEDTNRPWDFDHIYAQNLIRYESGKALRGMPQLIKDWHGSIGNFRAWPLEANRSDGANELKEKFKDDVGNIYLKNYGVELKINSLEASFIDETQFTKHWMNCGTGLQYSTNHAERKHLVRAIVKRFFAIYKEWWDTLALKELHKDWD